ncbi:potassium channel family protein [Hymenobacter convexus]|uniref:potassium channel family protein n=1 Tax=Hymenobacter sp. CA1UV-4 TaxID=3063782 RepID=UPI002712931D|nr:potassium channel family protein [Hymenobacter sp. CA1UV-4]MDO7851164.1 potassium channel family protein [Hymenobacter sp. CA1UV-4]
MDTAAEWIENGTVAVPFAQPLTEAPTWRTRLAQWQDAARDPALSVLLGVQVLFIFVVGPLVSTGTLPRWQLEFFQLLMPLVSFFVLPRHSKVRPLILLTAGPILALELAENGVFAGMLLRMFVTVAITVLVAQAVFRAETVTTHQLLGAVVVYLNLALLFMGIFAAIKHAVPGAFQTFTHQPLKSGELLYFSITTLTSTGYGDLLPIHPLARSMANLEAVTGQLFLGTFLARVVTLHGKSRT